MKRLSILAAGVAMLALSGTYAAADCHDNSASTGAATTGSVANADNELANTTAQNSANSGTESTAGTSGAGEQIAKDGTHAPLEEPQQGAGVTQSEGGTTQNFGTATDTANAGGAAGAGAVAKDGQTMPMAESQGGGSADVATSQQDAEMQQQGGQTAAAQAGQGSTECQ